MTLPVEKVNVVRVFSHPASDSSVYHTGEVFLSAYSIETIQPSRDNCATSLVTLVSGAVYELSEPIHDLVNWVNDVRGRSAS